MAIVSMKALLETGVHFGHRTRRWNPKMKPYIFTERNGIHILDLQQTIVLIEEAYNAIRDAVAAGGDVLETQLEEMEQEGVELSADDLADIVYNLGLEQAGDNDLLEPDRARYCNASARCVASMPSQPARSAMGRPTFSTR